MVDVYVDANEEKLQLEGRGDDFISAYNECCTAMRNIYERSLELSSKEDTRLWNLMTHVDVKKHVHGIFAQNNIQAQVCSFHINLSVICRFRDTVYFSGS